MMKRKGKYCEICHKFLGFTMKDTPDGTIQIGQGTKKPLLSFCGKKCRKKYKEQG